MKKSSTRLATVGFVVLLVVGAIALAQHDSRKREREPVRPVAQANRTATPIQVDGDWSEALNRQSGPIVRGNNDRLTSYSSDSVPADPTVPEPATPSTSGDNPLRTGLTPQPYRTALPDLSDFQGSKDQPVSASGATQFANYDSSSADSKTQLASGEIPQQRPGWLSNPAQPAALPSTKLPSTSGRGSGLPSTTPAGPSSSSSPSAAPSSTPTLPQLPSRTGAAAGGTAVPGILPGMQPLPSLPTGTPANRPGVGNGTGPQGSAAPATPAVNGGAGRPPLPSSTNRNDLSDTQRGALPATDLVTQPTPASPFGQPASGNSPTLPSWGSTASNSATAGPTNTNTPGVGAPSVGAPRTGTPASPGIPSGPATSNTSVPIGVPSLGAATSGTSIPKNGFPAANPTITPPTGVAGTVGSNRAPGLGKLVSNQPGDRYLDGSQNPIMLIQKRAPEEIQVGKNATFVITVSNAGNAVAHDVTVVDSVPRGARLAQAVPAVTPSADGILTWKLGAIAAGDERTITLQIVPEVQGEVGSVATVHFATQASVRTVATMPKLEVSLESQPDVLIGDQQQVHINIRNAGTGVARGVRLEADIPPELRHESGDALLKADLRDLRPNESKRVTLTVNAVQPGQSKCVVRAVSEDGVQVEDSVPVDVRAPKLQATIQGPKLRYLERQATYAIAVTNTGTAAATDLNFVVHLPAGLKFNSANHHGTYDPASHSVSWGLYELPAGQTAPMELIVLPVELGPQVLRLAAKGNLGIAAEAKQQVTVDGLAELAFTIGQDNGTIEVGTSSTYSVQVTNVGNKPDKNIQLRVELPAGTELLAVDAPVEYRAQGNVVLFAPIAEMRNKDQYTYRFQVRHNQAGTQIVRTKLTSVNWPVAVVKEEGTLVYNDQN